MLKIKEKNITSTCKSLSKTKNVKNILETHQAFVLHLQNMLPRNSLFLSPRTKTEKAPPLPYITETTTAM